MKIFKRLSMAVALVTMLGSVTPVLAQAPQDPQHTASAAALRQAIETQTATQAQVRQDVRTLLKHDQVREVAERLGLNVTRADQAVDTLSSQELEELAEPVRAANKELAGGANTIVISTTTLLLIIIIVILLVD